MAEEELSASWKDHALEPAWRMRAVFEQKVMAPYRDTYRGDLGPAQVEALEELYQAGELRQQQPSGSRSSMHRRLQRGSRGVASRGRCQTMRTAAAARSA